MSFPTLYHSCFPVWLVWLPDQINMQECSHAEVLHMIVGCNRLQLDKLTEGPNLGPKRNGHGVTNQLIYVLLAISTACGSKVGLQIATENS